MRARPRHLRQLRCRPALAVAAALGAVVVAPASASAASTSVIVYQCPDGAHICAVSPSGGAPAQLAQTGTLAGLTGDGATYGYAAPSVSVPGHEGLFEAPVAGGTPTEVSSNALGAGADPPAPVMSPDGSAFLEHRDQPGYFSTPDTDDIFQFSVSAGPSAQPAVVDSSTRFGMTYGWLGDSPLTTHTAGVDLQPPSWACVGYAPSAGQDFCADTDPHAKIQSASSTIDFPDGSPNGNEIVAILGAPGQVGGAIALFNAATGTMISTVAAPPAGVVYATPRFSPDGSQIVFESDPVSGGGPSIETVNVGGGQPRLLAQGGNPFWGGTTIPLGPGPVVLAPAPKVGLVVPRQTLRAVRRARRLTVRCTLASAGRCAVRVAISGRTAQRLGLSRHGRGVTLASGSRTLRRRGAVTLRLRLSRRTLAVLRRVRRLPVMVTATSSRAGERARQVARTVLLTRPPVADTDSGLPPAGATVAQELEHERAPG